MQNPQKRIRTLSIALPCALILGTVVTFAQRRFASLSAGRPEVKVSLTGAVERKDELVPVERADMVKSGETLDWTMTSANTGSAPAYNYQTVGKIPPGTQFVANSAKAEGSAIVSYSIDGGKTFSAKPMVDVRQPDGSLKKVPAPVDSYTQVRYEWADPLRENGKLTAAYKVRLR
jgi:uncharacterized repeat protein (TIGR01451 family)